MKMGNPATDFRPTRSLYPRTTVVHATNIHDGKAARRVLEERVKDGRKQKIWADMGYKGKAFAEWVKAQFGGDFEVINRKEKGPGFQIFHAAGWSRERSLG